MLSRIRSVINALFAEDFDTGRHGKLGKFGEPRNSKRSFARPRLIRNGTLHTN